MIAANDSSPASQDSLNGPQAGNQHIVCGAASSVSSKTKWIAFPASDVALDFHWVARLGVPLKVLAECRKAFVGAALSPTLSDQYTAISRIYCRMLGASGVDARPIRIELGRWAAAAHRLRRWPISAHSSRNLRASQQQPC
jgi:hypothetical protein